MATERLPMHKAREILRLKWTEARRHRQIARALRVGSGWALSVRWCAPRPPPAWTVPRWRR
jgi:hypothetical protein